MNSSIEYCSITTTRYIIFFPSIMKFAIEKKALYISIKNPVYGLYIVVYCSTGKNTNVHCNKQAAILIQGT